MENGNLGKRDSYLCDVLNLFFKTPEIQAYEMNRLEFNLTRENAGYYTCSAWNSNGRAEKSIRVDYYGEYLL